MWILRMRRKPPASQAVIWNERCKAIGNISSNVGVIIVVAAILRPYLEKIEPESRLFKYDALAWLAVGIALILVHVALIGALKEEKKDE